MAFVLLLLLSITTLVQVESGSSQIDKSRSEAEQAALLALNVAIGKLQETVGVDQRVTANASILGDNDNPYAAATQPALGLESWMGVWKSGTVAEDGSADYDPSDPNTREFLGWLVSATDGQGNLEIPTSLDAVQSVAPERDYVTLYEKSDGTPHVQVEKVPLGTNTSGSGQYFAFSVEDESAKVDLSWSETPQSSTSAVRYQSSRLAASPGPDYKALDENTGPFGDSDLTYPLSMSGSSAFLSDGISKITDIKDINAVLESVDEDWYRDQRTEMTWGSMGVLADVKLGGLRRDLSLAFEMDGDADISATEQPERFNEQEGIFVGGSDRFSSSYDVPGLDKRERYLWRETQSSGTPFSGDIQRSDSVLRGPTWWALRDYANMYKRLSGVEGDYSLTARACYPNLSGGATPLSSIYQAGSGARKIWDSEVGSQNNYSYRLARPNYAPVHLGTVAYISLLPYQGNLALCVDPVFFVWNPYNRKITYDSMAILLHRNAFPGSIKVWVSRPDPNNEGERLLDEVYGQSTLSSFFKTNASGGTDGGRGTYYILRDPDSSTITMDPGETMIFFADSVNTNAGQSPYVNRGFASPGLPDEDLNDRGIIMTQFPDPSGSIVPFDPNKDMVKFSYTNHGQSSAERFRVLTTLPGSITDPSELSYNNQKYGEQLESKVYHIAGYRINKNGIFDYVSDTAKNTTTPDPIVDDPIFISGKQYFGLFGVIKKPAYFGKDPANNLIDETPVEGFSKFNPLSPVFSQDLYCALPPNELYLAANSATSNSILNSFGFQWPGDDNAYWGASYQFGGATHVPMLDIPSSPLISIASFAHANLGFTSYDPFRMVGFSRNNPFISPESVYGAVQNTESAVTAQDSAWLINDILFDRYYLSGFAPEYTLSGGYAAQGTLKQTLGDFFTSEYWNAQANPVLRPYLPSGKTVGQVVDDLDSDDGYMKTGAYSLIQGAFNVNSTSVSAWEAFLRANMDLEVSFADGGLDDLTGVPFPTSASPVSPDSGVGISNEDWSGGFSRLQDAQINDLASAIVDQVKLRGPFMSLSDFVNRRTGTPVSEATHYSGALQAALDITETNSAAFNSAGGVLPVYSSETFSGVPSDLTNRSTGAGVPKEINQIDLLLPLAPRLTARGDTFRIRAYGEVEAINGDLVTALCEAVVQRVPEYVDKSDEPWAEIANPFDAKDGVNNYPLNGELNMVFGRQLKIVKFRWLDPSEV